MPYAGRVVQRTHTEPHQSALNQTKVNSVRLLVSKMLMITIVATSSRCISIYVEVQSNKKECNLITTPLLTLYSNCYDQQYFDESLFNAFVCTHIA